MPRLFKAFHDWVAIFYLFIYWLVGLVRSQRNPESPIQYLWLLPHPSPHPYAKGLQPSGWTSLPPASGSNNQAILAMHSLGLVICGSSLGPPAYFSSSPTHSLVQSEPFQMLLAVLSLISIIKPFSSAILWSSHVLAFIQVSLFCSSGYPET